MPARSNEYLTESKLCAALQTLTGELWGGTQVPISGRRYMWDGAYRTSDGTLVLVDYDGDEHYRHSLKLKADREKDRLAMAADARVVRFPYWLQLDSVTCHHFFDITSTVANPFPHGFITTPFFPASFCELGLERFMREFDQLPESVQEAVLSSLRDRVREHGLEWVLPKPIRHWAT